MPKELDDLLASAFADDVDRVARTKTVVALFKRWSLTTADQLLILGLQPDQQEILHAYHEGKKAFPNDRAVLDRVRYILEIHGVLRHLFPEDPALRWDWVNRHNGLLDGHTPLSVMLSDGLEGIARVARFVKGQLDE